MDAPSRHPGRSPQMHGIKDGSKAPFLLFYIASQIVANSHHCKLWQWLAPLNPAACRWLARPVSQQQRQYLTRNNDAVRLHTWKLNHLARV
jgi:hypothetical protein